MLRSAPLDRLKDLADPGRGLSSAAAASRQAAFGRNDIVVAAPNGWRELARDTVRDPMLWFLLFTATLFAALGQTGEAATLFVAIVPLVAMDAYLHWRTQASTAGLSGRLAAVATALRDAERRRLPAADLVPGDLVFVAAGEAFPADGILVETRDAKCDESALSGEAYPVHKSALAGFPAGEADAAIDTRHWGFAGTRLLTGSASLRVAFTGGETIYGEIVRSARAGRHARTPLQQAVAHLVGVLLTGAVVVCLLLAAIRLQQGHGVLDALLSAVTLAVAVLPEEFPVVLTFFLGVGVYRLARRQALVRRAVAVENIGRITCICSDKTGTLTAGTLALAHVYPAVEGDDRELLRIAALASRRETGDPMDLAILASAGATAPGEALATFPFTEDRRRETCILREGPGKLLAATKGAPETVLAMATLDADARGEWQRRVDQLAGTGHKVIACASRRLDDAGWAGGEPDRGLAFAGLLAFEDPVRDGAADAVRAARAAGIKVIMVTGDHPVTARAVGADIGLGDGTPEVVSGPDFERRLASEGAGFLAGIDVIARAAPGQKLALVRSLQQAGEIVAVTGDGVNDVPALQAADVGIAMGERGTQSAREVAAIVLLDDNFRTIVRAIAEGRQLFANLQLSFAYLLMIHMPLVLTAALVPAAGYPLLYLPAHIVWLELIIHPTALLVFQELPTRQRLDPVEPRSAVRFFSRRQWLVVAAVGALIALVVMLGYERSLGAGRDVEHARAMALVALIVASAVLAAALSRLRTWTAGIVVIASLGSAIACVQIAPLAALLHLAPLHVDDWAAAVLGGLGAALPTLGFRVAGRGRKSRSRVAA